VGRRCQLLFKPSLNLAVGLSPSAPYLKIKLICAGFFRKKVGKKMVSSV
jgi:hypothetical protein